MLYCSPPIVSFGKNTTAKRQQKVTHNIPSASDSFPDVPLHSLPKRVKVARTTTNNSVIMDPQCDEDDQTTK
jgi:hypothetical protein